MRWEVSQLRETARELQRKDEAQADLTRDLLFALQREADHWRHEHEKVLLRLENELLKFERRLPPPKSSDDEPKIIQ